MQSVLRKGASTVYLQYEHVGDTIGASDFVAKLIEGTLVISFVLTPSGSNQASDEERLHTDKLVQIELSDDYVIDNLRSFLASPNVKAQAIQVWITSKGKTLEFDVAVGPAGVGFLPLVVQ